MENFRTKVIGILELLHKDSIDSSICCADWSVFSAEQLGNILKGDIATLIKKMKKEELVDVEASL